MTLPPPITSRSNARVKELRAALSGRAALPGDLLGIEGEHLVAEAARTIPLFETIYLRQGSEALVDRAPFAQISARAWAVLSADVFSSAADTRSPQGVAATLRIPEVVENVAATGPARGASLVLVSLQDPGNLGTLIRSAEAFGVRRVFLTDDSVNPWSPKAVRASAGSVFRVPVRRGSLHDLRSWLGQSGDIVYAAVAQTDGAVSAAEAKLAGACSLMIGNEGAGLSAEALALATQRIWIPCAAESLNAAIAGSVLMYEAMRQNTAQQIEEALR